MGRRSYAAHRWLGAIVGAQLLLWSVGGFVFATHSITWVRGEDGMDDAPPPAIPLDAVRVSPASAAEAAGLDGTRAIELRVLAGRPVFEVRSEADAALVDARSGAPLEVTRELAAELAVADRAGAPAVRSIERVESDPPTEYRGGELPAWRVRLDDADDTHVYVSARTGRITARRNDAWRRFDLFWMLHTMDYRGRDDFNHPLLVGASALAVVTVGSGFLLWAQRVRRRRRSRRARAAG